MFLSTLIDLQEIFELHFQLLFINNDETKRNKNEKLKIILSIKNNFNFQMTSMVSNQ